MEVQEMQRSLRPGGVRMARQRKTKFEKLAESQKEAEQAARNAAALRRELMAEERAKDWRRKGVAGAAAFADAKKNQTSQEFLADMLHRAGINARNDRDKKEILEIEKYVRDGCPKFDLDAKLAEILKMKEQPPPSPVTPVANHPKPREGRPSPDR
jgi:hypothetical protein